MAKLKCIAIGGISNECSIYSPLFQAGADFEKIHEHIQEQSCRFIGRHHKRTLAPLRTSSDSLTLSVTVSPLSQFAYDHGPSVYIHQILDSDAVHSNLVV